MELDKESIDSKISSEIYDKEISERDKIEQQKRTKIFLNNLRKANNDNKD
jgi:hypothetical protein